MGLDNTKKRLEHESQAYKSAGLGGAAMGFRTTAASRIAYKPIVFGGKALKVPMAIPHGRLGAALGLVATGFGLKGLYHQLKASEASDTPIRTFLKIGFVKQGYELAGGIGGGLVGKGAVAAAQKLRTASLAFSKARSFTRATVVQSANVSTKTGKPAGKFIYRRIRGRIVPIRVTDLALPRGK